jgi:hypothetical protein
MKIIFLRNFHNFQFLKIRSRRILMEEAGSCILLLFQFINRPRTTRSTIADS